MHLDRQWRNTAKASYRQQAVDPVQRYVSVAAGANVPFSNADIARATNTFTANNGYMDPTSGSVATLGSMDHSLRANDRPGGNALLALLPMLLLSLLFGAVRSRRPSSFGHMGMRGFGGGRGRNT